MSNWIESNLSVEGENPSAVIDALADSFATVNQPIEVREANKLKYDCNRFFPNKQIAAVSQQFPENTIVVRSYDDNAQLAYIHTYRQGVQSGAETIFAEKKEE